MRLYKVVPNRLFMRGYFLKETPEKKQAMLDAYGVTAVMSNMTRHDPDMLEILQGHYLHRPLVDGRTFDPAPAEAASDEVVELLNDGHAVLVHCAGGRNRSGLVVALAVMKKYGLDGHNAVELVRKARPTALGNQLFVNYLESR